MLVGIEVGMSSPFGPICMDPIGKYAMFILRKSDAQSFDRPIAEPSNQSFNQSINQLINQSIDDRNPVHVIAPRVRETKARA